MGSRKETIKTEGRKPLLDNNNNNNNNNNKSSIDL
jgi:hypothetical protein